MKPTFAKNIQKRMDKLGMNQAELAKRARVRQGTISKIINGKLDPRLSTAVRIVRALGAGIDRMLQ